MKKTAQGSIPGWLHLQTALSSQPQDLTCWGQSTAGPPPQLLCPPPRFHGLLRDPANPSTAQIWSCPPASLIHKSSLPSSDCHQIKSKQQTWPMGACGLDPPRHLLLLLLARSTPATQSPWVLNCHLLSVISGPRAYDSLSLEYF